LNLPRPVEDLGAERHGNTVSLHWTTPAQTTLLTSIRALPEILLAEDFRPQDPTLPEALAAMLR
jgi:hypothetical protein